MAAHSKAVLTGKLALGVLVVPLGTGDKLVKNNCKRGRATEIHKSICVMTCSGTSGTFVMLVVQAPAQLRGVGFRQAKMGENKLRCRVHYVETPNRHM